MKRILTILAIAMVLVLSVVPAFASSGEAVSEPNYITVTAPDVYVNVEDNTPVVVYGTDAGYAVRSAFVGALTAIFGEYIPRTQTVTTYMPDGSVLQNVEYVSGLAGLDWTWIAAVVLFGIVIYCIFRMIGGVLKWK